MGKQHDIILKAYAAGTITWREAAGKLGISDFDKFLAVLKEAGLGLYEPSEAESEERLALLDRLLGE